MNSKNRRKKPYLFVSEKNNNTKLFKVSMFWQKCFFFFLFLFCIERCVSCAKLPTKSRKGLQISRENSRVIGWTGRKEKVSLLYPWKREKPAWDDSSKAMDYQSVKVYVANKNMKMFRLWVDERFWLVMIVGWNSWTWQKTKLSLT